MLENALGRQVFTQRALAFRDRKPAVRLANSPIIVGGAVTLGFLAVVSYFTFDHVSALAGMTKSSIANLVSQTELGLAA